MSQDKSGRCMFEGFLCCYNAIDCKNIELGCVGEEDICCIRHACCCSFSAKSLGCGITTKEDTNELLMIGAGCCNLGVVKPETCMSGAGQFLCCYDAHSFPLNEHYVEKCVCAYCFLQCAPNCGCCVSPPECPALDKMRRSKDDEEEIQPMVMEDRGDNADGASAPVEAEAKVVEEKGEDKESHA